MINVDHLTSDSRPPLSTNKPISTNIIHDWPIRIIISHHKWWVNLALVLPITSWEAMEAAKEAAAKLAAAEEESDAAGGELGQVLNHQWNVN